MGRGRMERSRTGKRCITEREILKKAYDRAFKANDLAGDLLGDTADKNLKIHPTVISKIKTLIGHTSHVASYLSDILEK